MVAGLREKGTASVTADRKDRGCAVTSGLRTALGRAEGESELALPPLCSQQMPEWALTAG